MALGGIGAQKYSDNNDTGRSRLSALPPRSRAPSDNDGWASMPPRRVRPLSSARLVERGYAGLLTLLAEPDPPL